LLIRLIFLSLFSISGFILVSFQQVLLFTGG